MQALIPEVYNAATPPGTTPATTPGTWRPLTGASRLVPSYPWMFLAPDGRVFNAGPNPDAKFLDPTVVNPDNTLGKWGATTYTTVLNKDREYGSAVMYAPGQVLILGGNTNTNAGVTNTAERIDLSNPGFRAAAPMQYRRTHLNATLLADGTVLATGGSAARSVLDADAVLPAELWTPPTTATGLGTWTTLNAMTTPRLYHSTAVLLPDATVLTTGGGEGGGYISHPDYEIFTPPYLCKGRPRPEISSAPQAVAYGQAFTISSPDAATLGTGARVTLVRLSSVTHAFNMNQRFIPLSFTAKYGRLYLTAPSDPNGCPPGHYMLFLLDGQGTPSHASIINIGPGACSSLSITQWCGDINPNACSRTTSFTVQGGSAGSTYTWSVNGTAFGTAAGQTAINLTTSTDAPTVQVTVKLDNSTCGASSTLTSYFPGCALAR